MVQYFAGILAFLGKILVKKRLGYEKANCYTDALNLQESLDFLEQQKIIGLDILQKILMVVF